MDLLSYELGKKAGGGGNLEDKNVTITTNGQQTISADTGYDGLNSVNVTTNVDTQGRNAKLTTPTTYNYNEGIASFIETIDSLNISGMTNIRALFRNCTNLKAIPQLNTANVDNMHSLFEGCKSITSVPQLNTSNATDIGNMFAMCNSLTEIPYMDTSKVTDMSGLVNSCSNIQNVPILNTSKVTTMYRMINNTSTLTDQSLDNILQMCINTTSAYSREKTLKEVGAIISYYPASRIQALPHYQDFIDAGWTIGY